MMVTMVNEMLMMMLTMTIIIIIISSSSASSSSSSSSSSFSIIIIIIIIIGRGFGSITKPCEIRCLHSASPNRHSLRREAAPPRMLTAAGKSPALTSGPQHASVGVATVRTVRNDDTHKSRSVNNVCMHVRMYVCMCARVYACAYRRMYTYTCVRVYVCVYVCMYACMCLFIHACMFRLGHNIRHPCSAWCLICW